MNGGAVYISVEEWKMTQTLLLLLALLKKQTQHYTEK